MPEAGLDCGKAMEAVNHQWFLCSSMVQLYIEFRLCIADDLPRKRLPQLYKPPTPEMLAYLDFSVSTTGMLTGVKVNPLTLFW